MFDVLVLVFWSFRFNKNSRVEKRRNMLEKWRKLKRVMRH